MAFSIDPADLIGTAVSDLVKASIIIGLPSPTAPIPNFIIATIPREQAQGSVNLPSLQLTEGDYLMKVAVNSGSYGMTVILSNEDPIPLEWLDGVATALQQLANLSNNIASFGAVLPNLASVTSNFVSSQLSVLYAMKNNGQPLMILNSFIHLGSLSQTNPNLASNWFIENINVVREEAEGGLVVSLQVRELLTKRDSVFSPKNLLSNIAGVATAGAAGSSIL